MIVFIDNNQNVDMHKSRESAVLPENFIRVLQCYITAVLTEPKVVYDQTRKQFKQKYIVRLRI